MASQNIDESALAKELIGKVQQFLSYQAESNGNLSDAAKESLTVAMECIEQAYSLERRPASNELINIYRSHKQQQSSFTGGSGAQATAGPNQQLFQNIASTLFSNLAGVGGAAAAAGGASSTTPAPSSQAETPINQASTNSATQTQASQPARATRKQATEAEKLAAESFKNQGNDLMKEDKFREAYDCYTSAIEIDNNNAIYYSNRAAASSKLGDHQAALSDCQEAIDIDPRYSKAYGRMGLAYASMENHQKSKEAYVKAVELDPNNESYRNNLQVAEERLNVQPNLGAENQAGGAGAQGNNIANILRSVMGNQEVMSMAMRSLQDPRMQNVFGNILGGVVGNMTSNVSGAAGAAAASATAASGQTTGGGATTGGPTTGSATVNNDGSEQRSSATAPGQQDTDNTQSGQQQSQDTSNPRNPSGTTPNIQTDVFSALGPSAQQLFSMTAESLLSSVNNVDQNDVANRLRQFLNPAAQQDNNRNDSQDRNPPPGYS